MKIWNSLQYNEEDVETLKRMFSEFASLADIGIALHRSAASVCQKVQKLKLKRDYRVVRLVTNYGPDVLAVAKDPAAIKALAKRQRREEFELRQKRKAQQQQQILEKLKLDITAGTDYAKAIKAAHKAGASMRQISVELGVSQWAVQSRISTPKRCREANPWGW